MGTILTVLTIISTLLTIVTQLGAFGDFRIPHLPGKPVRQGEPNPGVVVGPGPAPREVEAGLSVSRGSGPSGTEIVLQGRGFGAKETVEIRFHTEPIAVAMANQKGEFSEGARIPGSFDVFAPRTLWLVATGRSSARTARTPFELTRRN